jgi:hypothetical protein
VAGVRVPIALDGDLEGSSCGFPDDGLHVGNALWLHDAVQSCRQNLNTRFDVAMDLRHLSSAGFRTGTYWASRALIASSIFSSLPHEGRWVFSGHARYWASVKRRLVGGDVHFGSDCGAGCCPLYALPLLHHNLGMPKCMISESFLEQFPSPVGM